VKYLIMIHSNPASRALWDELTDEQQREFGLGHGRLSKELAASGELLASEGLADQSEAKRVAVRGGRTVTWDGPFAEVKEYLAGFYLIECESLEQAVAHAARVPDAWYREIEVRPVMELGGPEMSTEM
jgi:hypothetical protein